MKKEPDSDSPADNTSKKTTVEDALKGKTMYVYLYMQRKHEPVGIREIQRDLGLSSPSLANYHLSKLVELSLVRQDEYGRYFVTQRVQLGILQAFVNIGGFNIPRLSFFAAFFTTLLFTYVLLNLNSLNIHAVGFALTGAAAFWFETIKVWKMRPLTKPS